ncbi:MAG: polyphosphate--glucose phosphotransferase [Mycobacteriaceae bacterium]
MTQPPSPSPSTSSINQSAAAIEGFGVDIGGSGIKGGLVDLSTGLLIGERIKIETPQPSTPQEVAKVVRRIVDSFNWDGSVGITLPSVVTDGVVRTAANIDASWIGLNATKLFSAALDGQSVTVINDADAAGLAEDQHGAGRNISGVVILLTFGTGIGSAVLHNGVLIPNTEFGHLEVDGEEAEHKAASSVKDKENLTYQQWAEKVSQVLCRIEDLMYPDLYILGGGISRKAEKWIPLLTNHTPVVAATLQNSAGIVGAAMAADTGMGT